MEALGLLLGQGILLVIGIYMGVYLTAQFFYKRSITIWEIALFSIAWTMFWVSNNF